MPAARQAAAARAAAPAPAPALATAAVQDSMIYKLLMQFSSPKGISCDIAKSMWPRVEGLPDRVKGKIEQWQNRAQGTLKISWIEADGSEKYDVDALVHLLEHDFQLLKGPRGEALLLRGAAAREAAAAAPKETIDVKYMDGAMERTQTWTIEPSPEAIDADARKEARHGATINRRKDNIDSPFKMWYNGMLPPKLVLAESGGVWRTLAVFPKTRPPSILAADFL